IDYNFSHRPLPSTTQHVRASTLMMAPSTKVAKITKNGGKDIRLFFGGIPSGSQKQLPTPGFKFWNTTKKYWNCKLKKKPVKYGATTDS
ncbi:hypothetical protein L208DRAFT_1416033, partial [Tricholoma matsutake]